MYPAKSVDVFKSSQKRAIKKTEHLPKNEMEHNTDDIRVQGKGIQKEWNSIKLVKNIYTYTDVCIYVIIDIRSS